MEAETTAAAAAATTTAITTTTATTIVTSNTTTYSLKQQQQRDIIEVGEQFYVTWRNGDIQAGEVIEKRRLKKSTHKQLDMIGSNNNNNNNNNMENNNTEILSLEDYEYYIHFPQFDRRLDEWVTIDRIDLESTVLSDAFDQHQKNKHKHHHSHHHHSQQHHLLQLHQQQPKRSKSETDINDPQQTKKEEKEMMLVTLEKEHEEMTKVKNIQSIVLGKFEIETWYFAPYPEDYCGEDVLYVCEFCLKYMKKRATLRRHYEKCPMRTPPGQLIYNKEGLSMYEVDGKNHKIYCQNLCLLSKLFLDHKTLYYDVDPFLFYVLCEVDINGSHIVGYFSKEKHSQENYNLACILTFPPYQRKGYGKFLISISYELSKRENATGSPEKPLSDLGKISYRSYWAFVVLTYLNQSQAEKDNITIADIARHTGIRTEDILSTLHTLNLIKYWKGQHVISISAPVIQSHLAQAKEINLCDPAYLQWSPPDKNAGAVQLSKK